MSAELMERVAELLAPIPGDAPTGRDMRFAPDYGAIHEARREEDARMPRGVWVRDVKQADWAQVERLCTRLLRDQSKDLRVASWLAEAWTHRHGHAGLAPALHLIEGLVTRYWDDLHPDIDGDPEVHIAAIDWLNQRLPLALRQLPVVVHPLIPDQRYSWADRLSAEQLETVRLKDSGAAQRSEAGGALTLEKFDACRDRTDDSVFAGIAQAMMDARDALDMLDGALDLRCGRDSPGLGRIRGAVEDIGGFARDLLAARGALAPLPALPSPPPPTASPPMAVPVAAAVASPPVSRDAAYRQLAAIAAALRVVEPHSPIPYVLDYLVECAALPLPRLEAELNASGSGLSMLLAAIAPEEERD